MCIKMQTERKYLFKHIYIGTKNLALQDSSAKRQYLYGRLVFILLMIVFLKSIGHVEKCVL